MPKSVEPINSKEIINQLKQACDTKDYETQLKCYQALGDYYLEEKRDPINAIALYNFALAIAGDEQKNRRFSQQGYDKIIIDRIKKAEQQFLFHATNQPIPPSDYALDKSHQFYLQNIRAEACAQLQRYQALTEIITSQLPTDISRLNGIRAIETVLEREQVSIRQIYKTINEQLRGFVRLLIEECKQVLGEPPCEYAVICFGSLARDEATPYSDLEFGILMEDIAEKYPKAMLYYGLEQGDYPLLQQLEAEIEQHKTYFRNLTQLLNIKILNLGETTPRMQDIAELREAGLAGRYSETPNKPGFSFDGNNAEGRKTPLGNKPFNDVPEEKKYELILTPNEMAQLHNGEWYQKDKHLSTVLLTVQVLEGSEKLGEAYEQAMEAILSATVHEQKESIVSISSKVETETLAVKTLIQERSLKLLHESVESYQFRGGMFEKEGHFFDAKYHLYRQPNMLLEHLATYFGVKAKSLWGRIEELFGPTGKAANEEAIWNLKETVSSILKLRLVSYLKNSYRDNHIIALDPTHPEKNRTLLAKHLGINYEYLFQIYAVLVPLQWAVKKFIERKGSVNVLPHHYP